MMTPCAHPALSTQQRYLGLFANYGGYRMNLNKIYRLPETICSIDASTTSLAFAVFKDRSLVHFGKLSFEGRNIYEKIGMAAKNSGTALDGFGIDAIIIEHTVFMNSPKTMADLSMVQGAILGSAQLSGIKNIKNVSPITWQTFIKNGKLTTEQRRDIMEAYPGKSKSWYKAKERDLRIEKTINFVNTYYDISISDHDIADAIGIGHYAINNWEKVSK
jgi:hypothetical protein